MDAAFQALEDAMPMKVSEFTFNMLSLIERGEVDIAVHIEGEALSLKRKGVPMDVWLWDSRPILTQTKTISRYSDAMQKKLAFALLNRTLSPEFLNAFGDHFLCDPPAPRRRLPRRWPRPASGIRPMRSRISGYRTGISSSRTSSISPTV